MILLIDAPSSQLPSLAADMRLSEWGASIAQLLTPRRRHANGGGRFAIDNCAYSEWNAASFLSLLAREAPNRERCEWVAVPDVVGSAIRTREMFDLWYPKVCTWPLAYVCQDGQENVGIPWQHIAGVFIGGTTTWKLGPFAEQCIRAAQIAGKWVHVGRVNTWARLDKFASLGVDSIDGSGLARPGADYERERLRIGAMMTHPKLGDGDGMFGTQGLQQFGDGLERNSDERRAVSTDEGAMPSRELGNEGTTGGVTDAA